MRAIATIGQALASADLPRTLAQARMLPARVMLERAGTGDLAAADVGRPAGPRRRRRRLATPFATAHALLTCG